MEASIVAAAIKVATGITIDSKDLASNNMLMQTLRAKAGTCIEMSDFVLYYISKKFNNDLDQLRPEQVKLYRVGVIGRVESKIDHFCAIIGRTCGTDDWHTWNPETIIIDPWIGRWFYRSQLRIENPWPFHVPTQNIRFKTCMCVEDQTPTGAKSAATSKPRSMSF